MSHTSQKSSDDLVIQRCLNGETEAFGELVLSYQDRLFHALFHSFGDRTEAEDVVQEAFVQAFTKLSSFRRDSSFYTWLYRIAINTAKNHLVSAARRPAYYDLDLQDPEQYEVFAKLKDLDTPEGLTLSEEIRQTVNKAIYDLPEDLRTAILLREIEGMSYEEIAQTMECPVGTVRSRIFRARESIDKRISPLL